MYYIFCGFQNQILNFSKINTILYYAVNYINKNENIIWSMDTWNRDKMFSATLSLR